MPILDHKILAELELKESLRSPILCYGCGIEPECSGGLCGTCLLNRHLEVE